MDTLHMYGVQLIEVLQHHFSQWVPEMLFSSHLGDPRNAFLLYFPIAYFLSRPLGISVMWLAAGSEWLNTVLKWFLFGDRPYWWVNITPLYEDHNRPNLTQYELTCETGPGSPSGHAMCTSTVLFFMVAAFVRSFPCRPIRWLSWMCFGVFMLPVCVSRCFIATHFPHQVLAGTIVGCLLGYMGGRSNLQALSLLWYCFAAVFFLTSSVAVMELVSWAGWDAAWSVGLAKTWCAQAEWVHRDTTPMYSVTRDASQLLGLGVGNVLSPNKFSHPCMNLIAMVLSIGFTRGMEYVKIPQTDVTTFYVLAFVKNFMLPIVVVYVIPMLLERCFSTKQKNG